MLHPSYTELMAEINRRAEEEGTPTINSRYSIVIAAAKRARQLIAEQDSEVEDYENKKPLSVAVEELMRGDVKITSSGEDFDDFDESIMSSSDSYGSYSMDMDEEYVEEEEGDESFDSEDEDFEDEEMMDNEDSEE